MFSRLLSVKGIDRKVKELKITNVQQRNEIGNLNLQIKAEEFPYQRKVNELEERFILQKQGKTNGKKKFKKWKIHWKFVK